MKREINEKQKIKFIEKYTDFQICKNNDGKFALWGRDNCILCFKHYFTNFFDSYEECENYIRPLNLKLLPRFPEIYF
jgi:uncharacterized protein YbdZ (MbtH family)